MEFLTHNNFCAPIHIKPCPSFWLGLILFVSHGIALIILGIVYYVHPDFLLGIILVASILLLRVWQLYRYYVLSNPLYDSYLVLMRTDEELLEGLILASGAYAELLKSSYAHPLFVVLQARSNDKYISLIIWHNSLQSDNFRRLQVRIRHRISI